MSGNNPIPASFPGDEEGRTVSIDPGYFVVSESGPVGYTPSFSAECSGSILKGQTKTCTITNYDVKEFGVTTKVTTSSDT